MTSNLANRTCRKRLRYLSFDFVLFGRLITFFQQHLHQWFHGRRRGQELNLLTVNEVYGEMKDQDFELDVVTYGIIINAHCKAENKSFLQKKD